MADRPPTHYRSYSQKERVQKLDKDHNKHNTPAYVFGNGRVFLEKRNGGPYGS
jgi:hypothetical protein